MFVHLIISGFLMCLIMEIRYCGTNGEVFEQFCPFSCKCIEHFVNCSNKLMNNLPHDLPSEWVKRLDLSSNELNAANVSEQLNLLKNLTDLKLNRNMLTNVPVNHTLYSLNYFSLSHNRLTESSFSALNYVPNLRELDLSTNFIARLSAGAIPNLNALRTLNLNGNKITTIERGSLDALPKLIDLKLAKNSLRNLNKDVFKNLTALKFLDLSRNRFSNVEGLSFTGLSSVVSLKLKSNQIEKLADGAFFGLERLVSLYLDFNMIEEVTKGWLYGLTSLQQLYLSNNKIHSLDNVWESCQQLRELSLSHNYLKGIENDTLGQLAKLQALKLDNNLISYIAEGAFNHTPSLLELDLSGNKISWTIEDMNAPFVGLKRLTKLGLARNMITSVGDQALIGLESLLFLDLSSNQIKTIDAETLNFVPQLQDLWINSTSMVCDCSLAWLPELIHNNNIHTTDMRCAYPIRLSGQRLTSLLPQQFLCSPDDFPKPRITDEPKSLVAMSGCDVVLTCKAVSSSATAMSFRWRRNNRDLAEPEVSLSQNMSVTDEDAGITQVSQLQLHNVSLDASALYQCIVSNDFGTVYSRKANLSVYTFPQLVKSPGNVTIKTGSMARLECAASGHPSPQIGWQKDGGTDFPAAQERRVHVMPTDDVFFIVNVKPVDSGVYSCTAQNIAGVVVANATLTVVEPPSFMKKMEDKTVRAGEAVVLECMASGWPKPSLHWTKNGGTLHVTERHFFTAEDQLLIIMDTVISDSGRYDCEMTNSLGTNKGQAHLTVLPVYDSAVNEDDITGVIIISVVCCAVGTSVVWVIIIYQTRKRLNTTTPVKTFHLDNKSESSSKDSGTGDSTKRSHEDLLLETVTCVHQEGDRSTSPEVTLPLLTTFHPYGETTTAVYKVPCCCKNATPSAVEASATRTDHDRPYVCVPLPIYLPSSPPAPASSQPV